MTTLPPTDLTLSVLREPGTLTVRVGGELDHHTGDDFVDTVVDELTAHQAPPREVHLDFRDLAWLDSSGLAALLMIHRRTSALGATLHLDHQPEILRRMLHLTDVLGHLTAPPAGARDPEAGESDGRTGTGAT